MDTTNFQITEIEEAVLGALMIEKKAFPLVAQTLRPEMFYHEKEQTLYAVLENMHRNNEPIDILTVKEALQKRGKLDEAGGAYGIVRLSSKVTSSAHIELHAELIKDRYLRRELIVGINSLTSQSEDPTYDIEDILNALHLLTDRIENECGWTQQLRPMQQLMEETIAEAEQRIENGKNGVTGIPIRPPDVRLASVRPEHHRHPSLGGQDCHSPASGKSRCKRRTVCGVLQYRDAGRAAIRPTDWV